MECEKLMDFDSVKIKIKELLEKFLKIKEALKYDEKKQKIEKLEKETLKDGFWEDSKKSSEILSNMKALKAVIEKIDNLQKSISDAQDYIEIAEELNDNESYKEAQKLTYFLEAKLEKLNIQTLLSGEYDVNNAIITIHPGAGGTESHDWAQMLYRMYIKWCNKSEFEVEVLDMQEGEEAGIKSISFLVKGTNAYGYLKSENGVHRLVRISPFDANSRRHTSFASVSVSPLFESNDIDIEINDNDIRI